jgi:hypothetical protein
MEPGQKKQRLGLGLTMPPTQTMFNTSILKHMSVDFINELFTKFKHDKIFINIKFYNIFNIDGRLIIYVESITFKDLSKPDQM